MRGQVFFEGPECTRRLSRYSLLLLSAVIASAGMLPGRWRPAVHAGAGYQPGSAAGSGGRPASLSRVPGREKTAYLAGR